MMRGMTLSVSLTMALFSFYSLQPRADATIMRVDFSGVATSGPLDTTAYSGFFTYDDTGLINTNDQVLTGSTTPGMEDDLQFIFGPISFTESDASVWLLDYSNTPNLDRWGLGGDDGGGSRTMIAGPLTAVVDDISLRNDASSGGRYTIDSLDALGDLGVPTWTVAPVSVPEPTTMLLLGIGLVGLIGASARRRLKQETK